ncbi:MAG: nicotinate-nucleotide adenylyltransferase [Anaerolineae bacterium]
MGRRIGLLGGTFDPPHLGHLWLAETARTQLDLDVVLFLPVGQPPHKQDRPVTAVHHRAAMTELAIQNYPHFLLDETDVTRPCPHTTVSLLPLMQAKHPDDTFWLLVGADSLQDLPTWAEPARLITYCRIDALPRTGAVLDWAVLETAVSGIRTAVDLLPGPQLTLSSTEIRQWAGWGHSVEVLVGTAVHDYLVLHRLYQ